MNESMPPLDSLWMRCFWQRIDELQKKGSETIQFRDVDEMVIEKSRMPAEELRKLISDTAEPCTHPYHYITPISGYAQWCMKCGAINHSGGSEWRNPIGP